MLSRDPDQQPIAVEPTLHSLSERDTVTLRVAGISVKCVVLRVGGHRAMVVPMEEVGLDRYNFEGEVAKIEVENETLNFLITKTVTLPGLIGTLRIDKFTPNQRHLYRLRSELTMEISTDSEDWHTALVENVSEGGLLAVDPGVPGIAPCRMVALRLHLPERKPILVNGIVGRIETPWPGTYDRRRRLVVEFKEISRDDARTLVKYIYQSQIDAAAYR